MLAYHKPDELPQLGLPDLCVCIPLQLRVLHILNRIGTPEVAQLVANVSHIYSPELSIGYTPVCSLIGPQRADIALTFANFRLVVLIIW